MTSDKLKILVLDDEPIVCKRLKPALEKQGYSVDTFTQSVGRHGTDPGDGLRHHNH